MVVILQGSLEAWWDERNTKDRDQSYHANLDLAQQYLTKLLDRDSLLPDMRRRGLGGPTLRYMQDRLLDLLLAMLSPEPERRSTATSIWLTFKRTLYRKSGSFCGACCENGVLLVE